MNLSPTKLESPQQELFKSGRMEKKPSGKFKFIKTEQEEQQIQAQNNRDRIKLNLRGSISLIVNKSIPIIKDDVEELLELGRKLDVEINTFDIENICPNTQQFIDQYEILETLGEGCLGLVKKIRHKETQNLYAVKIVQTQEDEVIRNMLIEFKRLLKLSHDHIVKVYKLFVNFDNSFQSESKAYVVMELVDGQEMFEVLNSLGHYSEADAKELFSQLLSAIEYLHRNGICHRDLKPNNILCLNNQKKIKVTDFNVSKFSDQYKEFGDLKDREKIEMWTYTGTVAFSAPEIFTGEGYNQMVDMWSAGCILYSMLSGQLPFNADYLNDLIDNIKEAKIIFPKDLFQGVSEEAKNLITQLLQKDWTLRPHPDTALKHPWFGDDELLLLSQKSLLVRLSQRKNDPRLTSKFSRNNQRQRSILLGSQQLIINLHSMQLKQESQFDENQSFTDTPNLQSMILDSCQKKSHFSFTTFKIPENELSINQYLPPCLSEQENEIEQFNICQFDQLDQLLQCSGKFPIDDKTKNHEEGH